MARMASLTHRNPFPHNSLGEKPIPEKWFQETFDQMALFYFIYLWLFSSSTMMSVTY